MEYYIRALQNRKLGGVNHLFPRGSMEIFLFSNHYLMPNVFCNKQEKSIIIKGVEKNMNTNIKKVKMITDSKGLRSSAKFLLTFSYEVSPGM